MARREKEKQGNKMGGKSKISKKKKKRWGLGISVQLRHSKKPPIV